MAVLVMLIQNSQNSEISFITQNDDSNISSTFKKVLRHVSTQIIVSPETDKLNQTDLKVTIARENNTNDQLKQVRKKLQE